MYIKSRVHGCAITIASAILFLFISSTRSTLFAQQEAAPQEKTQQTQPDKANLVAMLSMVVEQLENKQYAETEQYFFLPKEFEHSMFASLLERDVIGRSGVEAMAIAGIFGQASDVFGKKEAARYAERFNVSVEECYGFKLKQEDTTSEVIAHWTGQHFKIIHLRNLGKIKVAALVAKPPSQDISWPTGDEPSKRLLLETLSVFLQQVQAEQYIQALKNIHAPGDFRAERLQDIIDRNELSVEGIKVLAANGEYGTAEKVLKKMRADHFAKQAGVAVEQCYGLAAQVGDERGETMAQWTGDRFRFVRINDIGKLASNPSAVDSKPTLESPAPRISKPENSKMPSVATPAIPNSSIDSSTNEQLAIKPETFTYETDATKVLANLQAIQQSVSDKPNDVSLRSRYVQNLLVIGNLPEAWTQATAAYKVDPNNSEVILAIDASIEALKKQGVFQVGVPKDTYLSLMGEPMSKSPNGDKMRWSYPRWQIDFNQDRFIDINRVAQPKVASGGEVDTTQPPMTDSVETSAANKNTTESIETNPEPVVATKFNVMVTKFDSKIATIKVLRKLRPLKLLEAINLLKADPPIVLEGVSELEAVEAKKLLEESGATVEIK